MPLYTTKKILEAAQQSGENFAVPAFNVHNMEYTKAAVAAAEKQNAPVILMLGEPILKFAGLDTLANIAMFAAKHASVPVAVALDHGKSEANIQRCLDLGLSIMVDSSHLGYNENVAFTKAYADAAHEKGLSIEAELGTLSGSEDGEAESKANMTDPDQASDFVEKTGIDILAVAIGNVHGLYHGKQNIDVERLLAIKKRVSIPLVMHGGSDLPTDLTKRLIDAGITKFNIGTDLKIAFSQALKDILSKEPLPFQPFDSLQYAMDKTEEIAAEKIMLLNASDKAAIYHD